MWPCRRPPPPTASAPPSTHHFGPERCCLPSFSILSLRDVFCRHEFAVPALHSRAVCTSPLPLQSVPWMYMYMYEYIDREAARQSKVDKSPRLVTFHSPPFPPSPLPLSFSLSVSVSIFLILLCHQLLRGHPWRPRCTAFKGSASRLARLVQHLALYVLPRSID